MFTSSRWIGDATADGRSDILASGSVATGQDYWLGVFNGQQLNWNLVSYPTVQVVVPPAKTTVPNVTNLRLSEAKVIVANAKLTLGSVANNTGVADDTQLIVSWQSLPAQSQVNVGTKIDLLVSAVTQSTTGVKQVQFFNCSPSGYPVNLWSFNGSLGTWAKAGELSSQYGNWQGCPAQGSTPTNVDFGAVGEYFVVAVQIGGGCSGNEVDNSNCWPWSSSVFGNPKGATVSVVISTSSQN
jgi:hypothetical protein